MGVNQKKQLNNAASYLFFSAFVTSKLRQLPFALLSPILNALSITFNLLGYLVWCLATFMHPEQKPHQYEWYGFAQFKEQHRMAAVLGILGSVLSFVAIAYPVFLIPAVWLFLGSNIFWTISEYHKYKNPAIQDPDYSHKKQKNFLYYAGTMTAIGFVTALATTLSICFPITSLFVLIASGLICTGLGVLSFEYWLKCAMITNENNGTSESYRQMSSPLSLAHQIENQNQFDSDFQYAKLFTQPSPNDELQQCHDELDHLNNDASNRLN